MQPIDMVYCWCDGDDSVFKARKNSYLRRERNEHDKDFVGNHRFVDNEELKYSLRSLEMYAPWIHHVYIVTDRQVPKWLNSNNRRISIVDHSEIMPPNIIPCFNSIVIEKFLANIPGLSEYFLYGNDDMFFGRSVAPEFFFGTDGKPIVYVKFFEKFKHIWDEEDFSRKYKSVESWMQTNLNAWKLLYDRYHKNEFYVLAHTIDGYRKSLFQTTIDRYKTDEKFYSLGRFRSADEVARSIFGLDMVYSGDAVLSIVETPSFWQKHIHKKRGYSWKCYCGSEDEKTRKQILRFEPYLFCINAAENSSLDDKMLMREFYEKMFPKPSSFELS